jgi:hypothetical protein
MVGQRPALQKMDLIAALHWHDAVCLYVAEAVTLSGRGEAVHLNGVRMRV